LKLCFAAKSGPSQYAAASWPSALMVSTSGAPACQIQSSSASTRCQWLTSSSASRNRIDVIAPRPPSAGTSRHVSR